MCFSLGTLCHIIHSQEKLPLEPEAGSGKDAKAEGVKIWIKRGLDERMKKKKTEANRSKSKYCPFFFPFLFLICPIILFRS